MECWLSCGWGPGCLMRPWAAARRPSGVLLLVAPRVFRTPEGPAAREARASLRSAPRLEARPCPPVPPAPSTPAVPVVLVCPARPAAHGHRSRASGPSGTLLTGGACGSGVSGPRHRLWAPLPGPAVSPVPSMPAVPVVLVCPARPRHRLRALQPGPPVPPQRRHRGTTSGLECPREARLGLTAAYTHPYGFR